MLNNYVLIDRITGKIINALSTPNEGVILTPESDEQEVRTISLEEFNAIFSGTYQYWNYETEEFEPTEAYKWVLATPGPYLPGLVTLVFEQRNWKDETVTRPVLVSVTVNGQSQQAQVEDGTLELELDCPEVMTLNVKIEAERHETFEAEVIING